MFDKDHKGYITTTGDFRLALQDTFCPGMKSVAQELTDEDVQVWSDLVITGDALWVIYNEG